MALVAPEQDPGVVGGRQLLDFADALLGTDRIALDRARDALTSDLSLLPSVDSRVANADGTELAVSAGLALDAGRHYSRLLKNGPCLLGPYELREEVGMG